MREKNVAIDRAYHFMAETLIIFLIFIPFFRTSEIPYWSYFGVVIAICILFSVYAISSKTNAWFISSIPLLIIFFYIAGFNLFFSILFASLCTWRFINICHSSILKRESIYILITLILSIILIVWFQDMMLITYLILVLFITVIGNICSHLSVLERKEQQGLTHKFIFYTCTTLGLGVIWVALLFKSEFVFAFLNAIFTNSILWTIETFAKGISYFIPEFEFHNGFQLENADLLYEYLTEDKKHPDTGENIFSWLIIIAIGAFIAVIIFFTVRHFHRRLLKVKYNRTNTALNYTEMDEPVTVKKGFMRTIFRSFGRSPEHRIRKLITATEIYHLCHIIYHRMTRNVPVNDRQFTTSLESCS